MSDGKLMEYNCPLCGQQMAILNDNYGFTYSCCNPGCPGESQYLIPAYIEALSLTMERVRSAPKMETESTQAIPSRDVESLLAAAERMRKIPYLKANMSVVKLADEILRLRATLTLEHTKIEDAETTIHMLQDNILHAADEIDAWKTRATHWCDLHTIACTRAETAEATLALEQHMDRSVREAVMAEKVGKALRDVNILRSESRGEEGR